MEAIIPQIEALAAGTDDAGRKSIIGALRELTFSIESSDDAITRIWGYPLQLSVARTAVNLGIFGLLNKSSRPMTVDDIQAVTKCDRNLLARTLRALAAFGMIKETGRDTFAKSATTPYLANKGNQGAIKHYFDTVGPLFQAMPGYFEKRGYRDLTDQNHTVWQDAYNCKENCFEWLLNHPDNYQSFNEYMASHRENLKSWLDEYPLAKAATDISPDRPLFVDVGGGIGHVCANFKAKYPDLPGRVILQDLPFSVDNALATPGVENMAHDFTKPQPVKGAKFYYMRSVLHDWPAEKSRLILQHLCAAMAPDSYILIDEMVAPNQGVPWQICQIDLTMMVSGASIERTEAEWADLYDSVGLKVHDRVVYTPGMYQAITVLVRK